jgi:hypothetical protein
MELLKSLYKISSPSGKEKKMRNFLIEKCTELGAESFTDKIGNIYITKGSAESYPCIVAHMDEVCPDRGKGYKVMEQNGRIFGMDTKNVKFAGIGGDDKNGIWVALKCLEKYDILKCVFFVGEEVGCVGSSKCNMDFFSDCRFVLQCDRRGGNDLITNASYTQLCSPEFLAVINYQQFGYAENQGMLTDVLTLKERGLGVCCLNISCGYYRPHSEEEYTIFSELENCLDFVQNIVENCTDTYPHKYEYNDYFSGYYGHYLGHKNDFFYYNGTADDKSNEDYDTYYQEYEMMEDEVSNIDFTGMTPEEEDELIDELLCVYPALAPVDIYDCIDSYKPMRRK